MQPAIQGDGVGGGYSDISYIRRLGPFLSFIYLIIYFIFILFFFFFWRGGVKI